MTDTAMTENEVTLADKQNFIEDLSETLVGSLHSMFDTDPNMTFNTVQMGFARSAELFVPDTIAPAVDYHVIGPAGDNAFILYCRNGEYGFGVFDEENLVCVPVDAHFIKSYLMEDPDIEAQYEAASAIMNVLDEIVKP